MCTRTLVVLGMVAGVSMSATASADPILAEFSRTANSLADDGVGAPPAPLQVVNNVDRTGRVETLVTDGTVPGNYAQAYANVTFGHLRVIAAARSTDGLQKGATGDAAMQDILSFAGSGVTGTTYRFSGAFSVDGSTSVPADIGALSVISARYNWGAYQDSIAIGGATTTFTRTSSGFGEEGVDFLGTVIPVAFDFVWGTPVILELGLGAGVGANSIVAGNFAAASVDMGNSLVWLGASLQTLDGTPLDGGMITSLSGTDWSQAAAVPEPWILSLLGPGAALVLRRRGSRPARPLNRPGGDRRAHEAAESA